MQYYHGDALYHHGILGQKWGKRNGPPYPLDQKTHNSVVKSEKKEHKDISDETKAKLKKAAIIGAAVVGTALVAYGGYKLYSSKKLNLYSDRGKTIIDASENILTQPLGDFSNFSEKDYVGNADVVHELVAWNEKCKQSPFKSLDEIPRFDASTLYDENGKLIPDRLLENINPDWPSLDARDNCPLTVATAVMRLKGYDVSSAKVDVSNGEAWSPVIFTRMFKNVSLEYTKDGEKVTKSEILSNLISQGNGAYGLFRIDRLGTPHAVLYYIEDGTAKFYDTQVHYSYKSEEIFKYIDYENVLIGRLDNCEPTDKVLGAVIERTDNENIIPFMRRKKR